MKLKLLIIAFINITLSLAHAEEYGAMASSQMQDRINRLERDLNILQKQFYRGGGKASSSSASGLNTDAAETESRLLMVEQQMRDLNGKIEEAQFGIKQLQERLDILSKDIDYRFSHPDKTKPTQDEPKSVTKQDETIPDSFTSDDEAIRKAASKSDASPKPLNQQLKELENKKANPTKEATQPEQVDNKEEEKKKEYDEAINLIKKSELDKAAEKLNTFIKKYGNDQYVGFAYYWLGEVYFSKKEFEKSAIQYLRGYKEFPKGKRAPDSLLKLAISLGNLKKLNEACSTLDKLKDRFPDMASSLKAKADKEYVRLGCKKS